MRRIATVDGLQVVGELTYSRFIQTKEVVVWRAVVAQLEGDVDSKFRLLVQVGANTDFQVAGDFTHGKALVKYVRECAQRRGLLEVPAVDTLGQIASRRPGSVVPQCYDAGPCKLEHCPYAETCVWMNEQVNAEIAEPIESDERFLERLQNKLSQHKWED